MRVAVALSVCQLPNHWLQHRCFCLALSPLFLLPTLLPVRLLAFKYWCGIKLEFGETCLDDILTSYWPASLCSPIFASVFIETPPIKAVMTYFHKNFKYKPVKSWISERIDLEQLSYQLTNRFLTLSDHSFVTLEWLFSGGFTQRLKICPLNSSTRIGDFLLFKRFFVEKSCLFWFFSGFDVCSCGIFLEIPEQAF